MKIIVTGMPACGKSYFLKIFKNLDKPVFSADEEIARLYQYEAEGWKVLRQHLGNIVAPDNQCVDKKILKELIFNTSLRLKIEKLIIPLVYKNLQAFWTEFEDSSNYTIAELPTFFETKYLFGQENFNAYVLGIHCPFNIRHKRLLDRGWTLETIKIMDSLHLSENKKMSLCDAVIFNTMSVDDFKRKIDIFISLLDSRRIIND